MDVNFEDQEAMKEARESIGQMLYNELFKQQKAAQGRDIANYLYNEFSVDELMEVQTQIATFLNGKKFPNGAVTIALSALLAQNACATQVAQDQEAMKTWENRMDYAAAQAEAAFAIIKDQVAGHMADDPGAPQCFKDKVASMGSWTTRDL